MEPPAHREPAAPPGGEDGPGDNTHALAPPPASARRFHHYEVCLRGDGVTFHELGRGTMGVSYKARDVNLDIAVAIKVIAADFSSSASARERFRREARAAAQLRHPNVASIYHAGETPEGVCFYAMEFIEGETLTARLERAGPLPVAQVLEVALQVTSALIAADERGLIHRDLKPANLMLVTGSRSRLAGRSGAAGSPLANPTVVKIIDFGLAKAVVAAESAAGPENPLTEAGGFLGTPAYASPEQTEGGEVDARSDIYSLGVTLWYLLTGGVPFAGRSLSEIYDRQRHRPLPTGQLEYANAPAPLVQLLRRMLAADPAQRPASPGVLYEALERCREEIGAPLASPFSRKIPASAAPRWTGPGLALFCIVLALLLAGGGIAAVYLLRRPGPAPAKAGGSAVAITAPEKSIAVLPLEDLSGDKAEAYFADGIQDDLLSSLARIKDLKVISRSSVMGYRNVATRNLREIGQQLGVIHILEGSVRHAADRVLVNVALIDARSGLQLWAEHYDRTLADSLSLQGELATEIAASLQATLSPEEKTRVETKPTENAEAYVLYLRARDYHTRPYVLEEDYQTAKRLYGEALALDPGFALAHAYLSSCLSFIYLNFQPTAANHDLARAEAEAALRLQPESGESRLALALCLYMTDKNYEAALRELEAAARLLPGSSEIDRVTGNIRRRQGRFTQTLLSFKRALASDPRSGFIAREILRTDWMLRDWPAAARDGMRLAALAPDSTLVQAEKCYIEVWSKGDLAPLRSALAAAPAGIDPNGEITYMRWDCALLERDFAGAERAVNNCALDAVVTQFGIPLPKSYLLGCIALARGDVARVHTLFETARPAMETEVRNLPQDPFRQARLGVLYAYLGRKEEALRLGRRAVELMPESKDRMFGPELSGLLALIRARTGETDQALADIERLLVAPGAVLPVFDGSITRSDLLLRWQWDPLRGNPRFKALLTGPEPKTIYQ